MVSTFFFCCCCPQQHPKEASLNSPLAFAMAAFKLRMPVGDEGSHCAQPPACESCSPASDCPQPAIAISPASVNLPCSPSHHALRCRAHRAAVPAASQRLAFVTILPFGGTGPSAGGCSRQVLVRNTSSLALRYLPLQVLAPPRC